jgi:hypothetical protein
VSHGSIARVVARVVAMGISVDVKKRQSNKVPGMGPVWVQVVYRGIVKRSSQWAERSWVYRTSIVAEGWPLAEHIPDECQY